MRTTHVILVGVFLTVLCPAASAAAIGSCLSNMAVTSSLVFGCGEGSSFDFGHDLQGNPANPLPLGGSVTLKNVTEIYYPDGTIELDLDFSFPHPAKGTTELDFSIFGPPPCNCVSPVGHMIGLGMSLSPFDIIRPNPVTESGSSFLIKETATTLLGDQATLSITGGDVFELGPGSDRVPPLYPTFRVTTMITDNAGDLTGFNEGFQNPEPPSWTLLGSGLFGIYALRLRGATGRINSYKRVRKSSSL